MNESLSVPLFSFYSTCSIYSLPKLRPAPTTIPRITTTIPCMRQSWCFVQTPMPAHRSVLAARLKILGTPDLDGSYGRGGIVVKLPEESRKELEEPLLEFVYVGSFAWGEDAETYYDNLGVVLYLAYCCRQTKIIWLSWWAWVQFLRTRGLYLSWVSVKSFLLFRNFIFVSLIKLHKQ